MPRALEMDLKESNVPSALGKDPKRRDVPRALRINPEVKDVLMGLWMNLAERKKLHQRERNILGALRMKPKKRKEALLWREKCAKHTKDRP